MGEFKIEPNKTYATMETARKAVNKMGAADLRHFIMRDEASGRFFPVFVGAECLQRGVHFHFNVVG